MKIQLKKIKKLLLYLKLSHLFLLLFYKFQEFYLIFLHLNFDQQLKLQLYLNLIKVKTTTIDSYCKKNNVESIDILKIDVQGNELKVLHGAKRMLKEKRVKLIFTEISIAPNYKEQSEIDEVIKLLRENEYKIFNFFKMKHKEGKLIECDILFYVEKLFV